jgi:hypothetical protein
MQRIYFTLITFLYKFKMQHFLRAVYVNLCMLFFVKYWKIKNKTEYYNVHCYGKIVNNINQKNWSDILSQYINKPYYNHCCQNTTNESILEAIVTNCSGFRKPKVIFILFEEIDIIEFFNENNTTSGVSYQYFQENTDNTLPFCMYKKLYSDVNLIFNFIKHLEYIDLFCEINKIELYWYISSKYMRLVDIKKYYELVNGKTLYTENKLKNIPQQNFSDDLAKEFTNLFLKNTNEYRIV